MRLQAKKNFNCFGALLVLGVGILTTACGRSPILHHATANSSFTATTIDGGSLDSGACALSFPKTSLCASIEWLVPPKTARGKTKGSFLIKFADSTGAPANPPGDVDAYVYMPEHGHGSDLITVVPALDRDGVAIKGQYYATGMRFTMPGQWVLHIQILVKGSEDVLEEVLVRLDI